jgi:hypothetical protein
VGSRRLTRKNIEGRQERKKKFGDKIGGRNEI